MPEIVSDWLYSGLPKRSHRTVLSDDELLLLDALFDKTLWLRPLQATEYALLQNTAYTHSFPDALLKERLESWVAEGVLQKEWDNHGPVVFQRYGLTPEGGSLWEAEREPNWEHYCSQWEQVDYEGDQMSFGIESPSLAMVEEHLAIAQRIGYYPRITEGPQRIQKEQLDGIEWKTFPVVYEIIVAGTGCPDEAIRDQWWESRPGWFSVDEISKYSEI